jgi:hypothetical protein
MFLVYEWQDSLYVSILHDEAPPSEQQPQLVSSIGGEWMWCKPVAHGLKTSPLEEGS